VPLLGERGLGVGVERRTSLRGRVMLGARGGARVRREGVGARPKMVTGTRLGSAGRNKIRDQRGDGPPTNTGGLVDDPPHRETVPTPTPTPE
jgi:hypothetical protein